MVYKKEEDRSKPLIILLYSLIVFALVLSFFISIQTPTIIRRAPEPPSFHEFYGTAKCDNTNNLNSITLSVIVSNATSSNTFSTNIQNGVYSIIVEGDKTGDSVTFFIGGNQVGADIYTKFSQTNKNLVQPTGQPGCQATYTGGDTGGSYSGGSSGGSSSSSTDLSVPSISNIAVSTSGTNPLFSWTTNIDSDSQVDFGPTSLLGTTRTTYLLTKNHVVELEDILPNTLYYYTVSSRAPNGVRAYSSTFTFVTPPLIPQCNDGLDNDGDLLIDLDDPDCVSSQDLSEIGEQTPAGGEFFTATRAILQVALLAVLTLTIIILGFVTYSSWALFKRKKK